MTRNRATLVSVFAVAALVASACGGSDEAADTSTDVAVTAAEQTDEPTGESGGSSEPAPLPATVDVPADWDPLVPTDPIAGVGLEFIDVRPFGDQSIYEVQYGGVDQDGEALYAAYEALVLAAGWTEADRATPLVGSYSQDDRTLVITTFGGPSSQIIVSVIPN